MCKKSQPHQSLQHSFGQKFKSASQVTSGSEHIAFVSAGSNAQFTCVVVSGVVFVVKDDVVGKHLPHLFGQ